MKMSDLAQNGEFWIEINGESVRAAAGTPLGQLLERRGGLSMPCGGMGRCGKCRVLLSGQASPPEEAELRLLSEEERKKGVRLAAYGWKGPAGFGFCGKRPRKSCWRRAESLQETAFSPLFSKSWAQRWI